MIYFKKTAIERISCVVPVPIPTPIYHFTHIDNFTSLSPMLYAIKCGNIEGIKLNDLILLKSTAQIVKSNGKKFVFSDGHGIMSLTDFYSDLEDLDEVDWEVINAKYWTDYEDGKRLRQAEFLVYKFFDWKFVELIGVRNRKMQVKVQTMLDNKKHRPPVLIKPRWYF